MAEQSTRHNGAATLDANTADILAELGLYYRCHRDGWGAFWIEQPPSDDVWLWRRRRRTKGRAAAAATSLRATRVAWSTTVTTS